MNRGINLLKQPVHDEDDRLRARAFREFVVAFAYTLSFAVDRGSDAATRAQEEEYVAVFGRGALIRGDLEDAFFSHIYVERSEREGIQRVLPALRPILVHGLPGAGKSTILKRIERAFKDTTTLVFKYMDLKANATLPIGADPMIFRSALQHFVYSELYDSLVHGQCDAEWREYYRAHDINYSVIREYLANSDFSLDGDDSTWENVLLNSAFIGGLKGKFIRPSLETLVGFLKGKGLYAICLDNVDRYPILEQRRILAQAIHLSNSTQFPVVLALRDVNMKRIVEGGENGDFVFVDEISKLSLSVPRDQAVGIDPVETTDQEALIRRRLRFLENYVGKHKLDEVLEQILPEGMAFDDFKPQFWKLYHAIAQTFVDEGLYQMSNHNLRSMMLSSFSLLSNVLLRPNSHFSVDSLQRANSRLRLTVLRTYFYRWLLLDDSFYSASSLLFLNVLDADLETGRRLIPIYILSFLQAEKTRGGRPRIRFDELATLFEDLGIPKSCLLRYLRAMSSKHRCDDQGLIWISSSTEDLADHDLVEILPSGRYFVEKLSISREYAFLCALFTEFSHGVCSRKFTMQQLYGDDELKLTTVLKVITDTLLKELPEEIARITALAIKRESSPHSWLWNISVAGELYVQRLSSSVLKSIRHACLPDERKRELTTEYTAAIKRANSVVNEVKLAAVE